MTLGFLHLALLAGLAGLAIPVLIHLWNRRTAPVVDWGAMMFLEMNPAQRRRLLLEEIFLLLLRLSIVAALVLALAGPIVRGAAVAFWTSPPRDVVFVLESSARMDRRDMAPSPWDRAVEALADETSRLGPSDRWTLVLAQRPAGVPLDGWQTGPPGPLDFVRAGNADGPAAVLRALDHLDRNARGPHREIVVLSDGLRGGWADPASLGHWEKLAPRLETTTLRYRAVVSDPNPMPPDYHVGPIELSRRHVATGQRIRLSAKIFADHLAPALLPGVRVTIDDVHLLPEIEGWDSAVGRGELRFDHVFRKPGTHLVSVALLPPTKANDTLAADNSRDLVVDVTPPISVLVVDGAETLSSESPAYFLMQAFAPADKSPVFVNARRVPASQFKADDLAQMQVVVLADVATLDPAAARAVDRFVHGGGGALVVLGSRSLPDTYSGQPWMPCRLTEILRSPSPIGIDEARLTHPYFSLFTRDGRSSLAAVRFGRHWRTIPEKNSQTLAVLANGNPWFVEGRHGMGRTIVSSAPFDTTWDNTLAGSWEFPVLAHELVALLADRGASPLNAPPGEPVRVGPPLFQPPWIDPPLPMAGSLHRDGEPSRPVLLDSWPGLVNAPGPAGRYRLQFGDRELPVVVQDAFDGDWSPMTAADRERLGEIVPIAWDERDARPATAGEAAIGRWMLVLLLALLALEAWFAGRMSRGT